MNDFKKRLEVEIEELKDKLDKLKLFLENDKFIELSSEFQSLLTIQASAMTTYLICLEQRFIKL